MQPERDPNAGLTREQAARLANVDPQIISMWALRGWLASDGTRHRLTVVGKGPRGARRYRQGDVIEAEKATRQNFRSHRSFRMPTFFTSAA